MRLEERTSVRLLGSSNTKTAASALPPIYRVEENNAKEQSRSILEFVAQSECLYFETNLLKKSATEKRSLAMHFTHGSKGANSHSKAASIQETFARVVHGSAVNDTIGCRNIVDDLVVCRVQYVPLNVLGSTFTRYYNRAPLPGLHHFAQQRTHGQRERLATKVERAET